jgi:hypothetical protein
LRSCAMWAGGKRGSDHPGANAGRAVMIYENLNSCRSTIDAHTKWIQIICLYSRW